MVTKLEFPMVDRNNLIPPHAQEVEYALILSRMISVVEGDPSQMRTMIYELARAKLKIDMARSMDISRAGDGERKRLSAALETAINGVEAFTARQAEQQSSQQSAPSRQIGTLHSQPDRATTLMPIYEPTSKSAFGGDIYSERAIPPILDMRARVLLSPFAKVLVGVLLFGIVAGLVIYRQRTAEFLASLNLPPTAIKTASNLVPSQQPPPPVAEQKTAASLLPLPSDYGVYVISNGALNELHLLSGQVPDKRIAMSTPLTEPSRTVIPDGKAKFVIYRRDLANSAPDRIDVRVVARVVRAIKFDARGKPLFSSVLDAWNIRNLSYELRVRPVAANPEMLLIQAENADFSLPAGRYVLALRNEGYDFTVAGEITDPKQCLERTDAANGSFYSDCEKQ